MSSISRKLPTVARVAPRSSSSSSSGSTGSSTSCRSRPRHRARWRSRARSPRRATSSRCSRPSRSSRARLLLAGALVPFALTLLAPIIVNIVAFHALPRAGKLRRRRPRARRRDLPGARQPRRLRAALRPPRVEHPEIRSDAPRDRGEPGGVARAHGAGPSMAFAGPARLRRPLRPGPISERASLRSLPKPSPPTPRPLFAPAPWRRPPA